MLSPRTTARAIACAVFLLLTALATTPAEAQWEFERGNVNDDATTDIADAIGILDHLFQAAPTVCADALDANDDGSVNIADAITLLDTLFGSGTPLPPPFMSCGPDPTADALDCVGPLSGCPASSCTDNADCPPGMYCQTLVGDCNGSGTCAPMPIACPAVFDPVCGCDGNTYGNACEAAMAGVGVDYEGECIPAGGCSDNTQCPPNEYCAKAVGDCNGVGSCQLRPVICTTIFAPVCGCDGNTYSNACMAAGAGMNVAFTGSCP